MLFNSFEFLVFFPIAVTVYFLLPRKIKYLWLLACSYYFYMGWNAKYALLLFASTAITFVSGVLIEYCEKKELPTVRKKWVVAGSFILNLSMLVYFKYAEFFMSTVDRGLGLFGAKPLFSSVTLDIVLPVGISFYIFQALSYTIDVYRGDIKAEKNFFKYALFVSFFPQLVAGPIERSGNLLRQVNEIDKRRMWSYAGRKKIWRYLLRCNQR